MDTSDSHPISDLVGSFLDAAQSLLASPSGLVRDTLPAELTYELDQVVSHYLDVNELSPDCYHAIQQDVVNSLANDLLAEADHESGLIAFDDHGNAGLTDVISFLDQHYTHLESFESVPQFSEDTGSESSLSGHG